MTKKIGGGFRTEGQPGQRFWWEKKRGWCVCVWVGGCGKKGLRLSCFMLVNVGKVTRHTAVRPLTDNHYLSSLKASLLLLPTLFSFHLFLATFQYFASKLCDNVGPQPHPRPPCEIQMKLLHTWITTIND